MTSEPRLVATPNGITLCRRDDIADGKARNFVIQLGAGRFFGFLVRYRNEVRGYVDRCPHMGLPLAMILDDYMTPAGDMIACSWHGAVFEIESGRCLGGPCQNHSLLPWPVHVRDGEIITGGE